MLAVWGSPGSGKTVTAVKIAKMLSAKKKNVILLLCDMTAPMLPCICSPDELECERSLGNILAAARIGENLIKHNLVTLKRSNYLTVLGLLKGENEYSIPPFTEKQAIELLDGLRQIAPYASSPSTINDTTRTTALASYITLGEQGRVVLHTKTETEVTLDDGSNESS